VQATDDSPLVVTIDGTLKLQGNSWSFRSILRTPIPLIPAKDTGGRAENCTLKYLSESNRTLGTLFIGSCKHNPGLLAAPNSFTGARGTLEKKA